MAFFDDTPWLRVPLWRQGGIGIEPSIYPSGLLGGSSTAGKGKISKLQALAAARQKKDAERTNRSSEGLNPAEDRGGSSTSFPAPSRRVKGVSQPDSEEVRHLQRNRSIAKRESIPSDFAEILEAVGPTKATSSTSRHIDLSGMPSAFATAILGPSTNGFPSHPADVVCDIHSVLYNTRYNAAENGAFLGPSPDDVVIAAQTNKGQSLDSATRAKSHRSTNFSGKAAGSESVSSAKATTSLENGVKGMTIDAPSRPKRKNIDVLLEYQKTEKKPSASFVVIGN